MQANKQLSVLLLFVTEHLSRLRYSRTYADICQSDVDQSVPRQVQVADVLLVWVWRATYTKKTENI